VKKLVIAAIAAASSLIVTLPATAQTAAKLNMAAEPDLDRDGVRTVQRVLREKAIDPGPIDGAAGPRTKGAVRTFQKRYGMKETGEIDNQLLFALGEAELAIAASR
jgi:peptidoglycan hydrolase-like protein with peptidoglycan-binding domain